MNVKMGNVVWYPNSFSNLYIDKYVLDKVLNDLKLSCE